MSILGVANVTTDSADIAIPSGTWWRDADDPTHIRIRDEFSGWAWNTRRMPRPVANPTPRARWMPVSRNRLYFGLIDFCQPYSTASLYFANVSAGRRIAQLDVFGHRSTAAVFDRLLESSPMPFVNWAYQLFLSRAQSGSGISAVLTQTRIDPLAEMIIKNMASYFRWLSAAKSQGLTFAARL